MTKINNFPSIEDRDRMNSLSKFNDLYENKSLAVLGLHELIKKQYKKVADLVYISHAIPSRISEFYADFVSGDVDKMVIKAGDGEQEHETFVEETVFENDLKEKINDIAVNQSIFGHVVLLGRTDENDNYIIEEVGADQYFPQKDGSVIFATYKKNPEIKDQLLLLTRHYKLVDVDGAKKCQITREAFATNNEGVATVEYPLEKMAEIVGYELEPTTTLEIDELPIRQIDNGKRDKKGFGKSDYADILPQLAEINERATQISTQLLKNLDAKLVVPSSLIDEETKRIPDGDTYGINQEDPTPQYLTNANTLMADAREHTTNEAKYISFITGVPMFELLKSAMPDRVESLRIQLFSALRKTARKRAKIKRAIMDMIRIGFKLRGMKFKQDPVLKFSDVLPVDENMQTTTESTKVQSGLSSRVHAIMRLENVSEDEAQAELDMINEEAKLAGVLDTSNPPIL